MFIPKIFNHDNQADIITLMNKNPLATVVYNDKHNLPQACHIPILYVNDDKGQRLIGHVHRGNTLWQNTDKPWLVIFTGASHYISPNWYPNKQKTHQEVPTYNYQAVHIRTQAVLVEELSAVKEILAQTTQFFEQKLASKTHDPWTLADAPDDFIDKLCPALVAFELSILDVQCAFKLSQNKSLENKQGVIEGLTALNTPDADIMANLINTMK